MNTSMKLTAGSSFPNVVVQTLDGTNITLGKAEHAKNWQALFVYRGAHCPICTQFLNRLEQEQHHFEKMGIELVAVSGDSLQQVERHLEQLMISYPLTFGLSVKQMESLGLYISNPRNEQETDHPFSEPALFVINEQGLLHVVDISNNPFTRPDITTLINGLNWIKNPANNYPIRGTY